MSSQPIHFVTVDNNTEKAKETFGTVVKVDLGSLHVESNH
jgi:hypothetical protein